MRDQKDKRIFADTEGLVDLVPGAALRKLADMPKLEDVKADEFCLRCSGTGRQRGKFVDPNDAPLCKCVTDQVEAIIAQGNKQPEAADFEI